MYPDKKPDCVHGVSGGCSLLCACGHKCSEHEWFQERLNDNSLGEPETRCGCDFKPADTVGVMIDSIKMRGR